MGALPPCVVASGVPPDVEGGHLAARKRRSDFVAHKYPGTCGWPAVLAAGLEATALRQAGCPPLPRWPCARVPGGKDPAKGSLGWTNGGKGRLNTKCKSKTMKTQICLLGFLALVTMAIAAPHTWTLKAGETVTGDYLSSCTTALVIRIDDTNCMLKIANLSSNDQVFVKNI